MVESCSWKDLESALDAWAEVFIMIDPPLRDAY